MKFYSTLLLGTCLSTGLYAQSTIDSSKFLRLTKYTAQQDQANMMQQLGVTKLRPGPSGNPKDANHANEDESLANPCPQLPDALLTKKVTLHRRVFGEAVESLAGSGQYHWMAGNYLKYAAEASSFGSKTGCDLPVDSHELLALCAPRPVLVSYSIPEKGDAKWLDQNGSFKSTVAAGTVYKMLGAKDLGVGNDYHAAVMPQALTGLLDGELAWRQHDAGHSDAPNFKFCIPWASRMLEYERTSK